MHKVKVQYRKGGLALRPLLLLSFLFLFSFARVFFAFADDLPQNPLFLSTSVDPNIMFILDDSGSMQFEITPDEHMGSTYYVFPKAKNTYGSNGYDNRIPTFEDSLFNAYLRSRNNASYYNPSVTYTPWSKADGSLYPLADPKKAYHNPLKTNVGYVDLTTQKNTSSGYDYGGGTAIPYNCSIAVSGLVSNCSSRSRVSYYPAFYYYLPEGKDFRTLGNYERVEIRSTTSKYVGHGRENRTDCVERDEDTCTYAEEIQNFANWYTYYRSRVLASRAAIGAAFSAQGKNLRVGYGAINSGNASIDSVSTSVIKLGVRPFVGADREMFFTRLYTDNIPTKGTPLRRALQAAGKYYQRSDNRGPWGAVPGTNDNSEHISCRQSYTILMTDGYWNGSNPSNISNEDKEGLKFSHKKEDGSTENFTISSTFSDNDSQTLADVAMHYWKNDLRTDLVNNVPPIAWRGQLDSKTGKASVVDRIDNPAFWQHMITFGIGLGVKGTIDRQDAYRAVVNKEKINWPGTGTNAGKIDDLLHASVNSRGGFFSAKDPVEFAIELKQVLSDISEDRNGSVAAIAASSTRISDNTMVYQALMDSRDWSGEVKAFKLNVADASISSQVWSTKDAGKIPPHTQRKLFSYNGSKGIEFLWDKLSLSQQNSLRQVDSVYEVSVSEGQDRLNWLRGDQSKENSKVGGYLRDRNTTVMGDIVNSDPVLAGFFNFGYNKLEGYSDFIKQSRTRKKILYVGANDGMLHAFDAETGLELFTYIPAFLFDKLHLLTNKNYEHKYYVDGKFGVGDAYISTPSDELKKWRNVLIGTLGAGGRGIFALDISDPYDSEDNKLRFSTKDIMWEYQDADLGYIMGKPVVGQLKNGKWAAIFGNGYKSDNKKAMLFIVDLSDGSIIKKIDTGVGTNAKPNGLSPVALIPNEDRVLEYAYAGDLQGNLWKFDLSSENPENWDVAYKKNKVNQPLFTALISKNNSPQSITSAVDIREHPDGGYMVLFGTGQYFDVGDNVVEGSPAIQSFYGIRDNGSPVSKEYRQSLLGQAITHEQKFANGSADTFRVISDNIDESGNKNDGCYLDLVFNGDGRGERVVEAPVLRDGRAIFSTMIPADDPCAPGGSGWLMQIDSLSCSRPQKAVYDTDGDDEISDSDLVTIGPGGKKVSASGVQFPQGIITRPTPVSGGNKDFLFLNDSSGNLHIKATPSAEGASLGRRSWHQRQ